MTHHADDNKHIVDDIISRFGVLHPNGLKKPIQSIRARQTPTSGISSKNADASTTSVVEAVSSSEHDDFFRNEMARQRDERRLLHEKKQVLALENEKERLKQSRLRLERDKASHEALKVNQECAALMLRESLIVAETARDKQREATLQADIKLAESIGTLECVVCLSEIATHIVLPCCHLALCSECGRASDMQECPVCRVAIERIARIYIPSSACTS
jgi:hypothetical protein